MDAILTKLAEEIPAILALIIFVIILTRDHNKAITAIQTNFEERMAKRDERFLATLQRQTDQLNSLEERMGEQATMSKAIMEFIIKTEEEKDKKNKK